MCHASNNHLFSSNKVFIIWYTFPLTYWLNPHFKTQTKPRKGNRIIWMRLYGLYGRPVNGSGGRWGEVLAGWEEGGTFPGGVMERGEKEVGVGECQGPVQPEPPEPVLNGTQLHSSLWTKVTGPNGRGSAGERVATGFGSSSQILGIALYAHTEYMSKWRLFSYAVLLLLLSPQYWRISPRKMFFSLLVSAASGHFGRWAAAQYSCVLH